MAQDAGLSQESNNKHSSISKIWWFWRTDRLNHVPKPISEKFIKPLISKLM